AATGEEKYHRYFLKEFDPGKKRWDWWPLFEGVGYATHAYLLLQDRPTDAAMLARCKEALRGACRMHVAHAASFPYRLSMPEPSIRHGNYGWVFPGDLAGYDLLIGYAVEKDRSYLECALDNLSYTCGANASGHFLQTGLGAKRSMEAVSDPSSWDTIIEPVPGLPLGIGSGEIYWFEKYGKRLAEGTYPEKWPLLNRWYDGFNVSSEFTMGPMVRETLVAGFFAGREKRPAKPPKIRIRVAQPSGPAPYRAAFDVATDPGVTLRQVFWDFGDESFSAQRAPVHVFSEPGRHYPVAVSVVTTDGRFGYATTEIDAVPSSPPFPTREAQPDDRTLLLFHLNGDLKDAAGRGELRAVTKRGQERRPFVFAPFAPAWLSPPGGSCLVLDGAEQLSVEVPKALVPDPAAMPLTLDLMLYLEEFAGWSYPGDPIVFGLQNEWDSLLGWQQETWDRGIAPRFGKAIPSERFAREFPRHRWCHVRITHDAAGKEQFFVDGKPWGAISGPVFRPGLKTPLVLTLGPFRGMVDEVRLRKGVE
ncbi:MAG: glycoside hydrolase, partial [Armatimonadetes bacterium]|nr:glycoside hydrolase [Armatimonadota bacterium]